MTLEDVVEEIITEEIWDEDDRSVAARRIARWVLSKWPGAPARFASPTPSLGRASPAPSLRRKSSTASAASGWGRAASTASAAAGLTHPVSRPPVSESVRDRGLRRLRSTGSMRRASERDPLVARKTSGSADIV